MYLYHAVAIFVGFPVYARANSQCMKQDQTISLQPLFGNMDLYLRKNKKAVLW